MELSTGFSRENYSRISDVQSTLRQLHMLPNSRNIQFPGAIYPWWATSFPFSSFAILKCQWYGCSSFVQTTITALNHSIGRPVIISTKKIRAQTQCTKLPLLQSLGEAIGKEPYPKNFLVWLIPNCHHLDKDDNFFFYGDSPCCDVK